ncbi:pentatricopeptide repeat-containing protein At1g80150, mitochondrial-like [Cucurbita maxima]|uniref:Pentatricopeptide repeat-containing protein At1g80150, mitochondrial-like n=1 Tax=Cucurbita maxima TaxID=3661 RepID=A0A6J1INV5_CUCMA|nr:pentatricopeptide repeat-containing protein At1g80150, mitochondrial-like [Cucurbita maxima]XP_022979498.1 pentatricopeptide repeat-containing protein At1g80150, mitochondrial-like [Cucurbita maxima]XP_022979499.1 pentatricopeptide repeat-containing protein At1g80150, mitochondrial-like [Cucurbita maxima]XP_022979500.1 pentatricopeptide repeat-containing protein At1g80150, mitochondrial-like [Cucurbita maxima]XP_022979501.1 pentatricopeptide repeat-containing protein At1g80150, mitochondrial
MLSLRPIRRFCHAATVIVSTETSMAVLNHVQNSKPVEEPALIKLKAERDPEKLFHLFKANAHNRLVIENRFAFEDTVSRLAGARRFDYIEHLLEHQKTLPQGRREGFIIRIIVLYGKAEMIKHAVDTFYNMHLYGCSRTVKSFNAVLKVLMKARDLGALEAFLREAPEKFNIELDIISVNIVVKAFCDMGILNRAYLLILEMEKVGIRPDVVTYTTLISALYKYNQCEISNGLWNLMVLRGCLPNLASFNVRIQYLVDRRRAWDANKLMNVMRNIGIVPDEVTYNLVIKGFCQAGFLDMAKRVYSALHGSGYKPNVKIYQTMIHYLCRSGDFNMAYTMCKDAMTKNWFPNIDTIHSLLKGLNKMGQPGKAQLILSLARKRVPPFSTTQLEALNTTMANG